MAAVLQGKLSNFETDLFVPLIREAARLTNQQYRPTERVAPTSYSDPLPEDYAEGEREKEQARIDARLLENPSLRIIADHARAATFLIGDGVLPANEGRGYVLRKILRRGIRHGRLLGQHDPFMHQMVFAVRDEMAGAYPELKQSADRVSRVVLAEERQFARVMEQGFERLEQDFAPLLAQKNGTATVTYPGAKAFHLYETYGLPLDFMVDAARDQGLEFDLPARRIASCRRRRSRATSIWCRPTPRCWPLCARARVCRRRRRAKRWMWCWTTLRFMPIQAGRWVTTAGCARTTTTR
jgi:alanyl-tRNA synthetase